MSNLTNPPPRSSGTSMSDLIRVTATGAIVAQGAAGSKRPCLLRSVVLQGGADAATVVVHTDGPAGIIKISLASAAGVSSVWSANSAGGVAMTDGIHVTITGTTPPVSVEFDAT